MEVVLAIGIVAFCVVPLIGALSVAYQQGREAQEKTELALVFQSVEAVLRGAVGRGTNSFASLQASLPQTNYFAEGGQYLGTNLSASGNTNLYRSVITTNALTGTPNRSGVRIVVQYPPPSYHKSVTNQFSLFSYGTRW
jgi:hypothetical protein